MSISQCLDPSDAKPYLIVSCTAVFYQSDVFLVGYLEHAPSTSYRI